MAHHSSSSFRSRLAEFYNRVGARPDLKHHDVVTLTWQVFSVLRQAIPEREIQDILESLTGEYGELFEAEEPNR